MLALLGRLRFMPPRTPSGEYFERHMPYTAALKMIPQEVTHRSEREMLLALINTINAMVFATREQGQILADLSAAVIVADKRAHDERQGREEWQDQNADWQRKIEEKMTETRRELRRVATSTVGKSELEDSKVHDMLELERQAAAKRRKGGHKSFASFLMRRVSGRVIDVAVTFILTATAMGVLYMIIQGIKSASGH